MNNRMEMTSVKISKDVLLDLLELLNEYDIKQYKGEGRASLSKQILEYHQMLGQTLRPLM